MNEVANKKNTEVSKQVKPDGFDEPFDREDVKMPRAKIAQATTQEFKDGKVKAGDIFNSLTIEVLPETFIPLFKFTFWIKWNPRQKDHPNFDPNYEPGAQVYRTDDPGDQRLTTDGQWGPNGEPPVATKYMNFLCLFEGKKAPITVSFSKTSMKAGQNLFSLAMTFAAENNESMYQRKYKLSTKKTGGADEYYIYQVNPDGKVDEERIPELKRLYEQYNMKKKDMHKDWEE